jgi:hypothetical protein
MDVCKGPGSGIWNVTTLKERIRILEKSRVKDEQHELLLYFWMCEGNIDGPNYFKKKGEMCPSGKKQYVKLLERKRKTLRTPNSYGFISLFCQGCEEKCQFAGP